MSAETSSVLSGIPIDLKAAQINMYDYAQEMDTEIFSKIVKGLKENNIMDYFYMGIIYLSVTKSK